MAAIEWSGFLTYKAKHSDIDSVLKASFVPVSFFMVKGGTKRIIDLRAVPNIQKLIVRQGLLRVHKIY